MTTPQKPLAVVLCSGIGGGTLGLLSAGYEVVLAVDISEFVNRNHERLTGIRPVRADLLSENLGDICRMRGVDPLSVALVLCSPKCEGATAMAGAAANPENPANDLLRRLPGMAAQVFSNADIVVENVLGVFARKMRPVLEECLDGLVAAGRTVPSIDDLCGKYTLNSADFGVAQVRRRIFIPAVVPGRPLPIWPEPTHSRDGNGKPKWIGIGDALASMPCDPDPRVLRFRKAEIACYGARESAWTREYVAKLAENHKNKWGSTRKAEDYFRGLDPTKPAPCLTSAMRRPSRCVGIHPDGKRYFSIGELMVALFGLPHDRGPFEGGIRDCWDMLADMIVPCVAQLVGEAILNKVGHDERAGSSTKSPVSTERLLPVFSCVKDEWSTPQPVFDDFDAEFGFTLDAASTHANAKCAKHFTMDDNGLKQDWGQETVWLNFPYSQPEAWIRKSVEAAKKGATVVALAMASTDTRWWCDWVIPHASEIRFIRGRLKFGDGSKPARFASAILVFRYGAKGPPKISWVNQDGSDIEINKPRNRSPGTASKDRAGIVAKAEQPPVIAVENSGNKKIGSVAATYASQATCPSSCPFLKNGCYAEVGPCGLHTMRLNASPMKDPLAIAKIEADLIQGIKNPRGLRVHTVGDCKSPEAAALVGSAMVGYQERTGGRAWTYTHGWKEVPVSAWGAANVLASCERLSEVREARARGYATAITLDEFRSKHSFIKDGIKFVPCPEQTIGKTCLECRICLNTTRLTQAGITIAFKAHGNKAKIVKNKVKGGLLRWMDEGLGWSA